MSDNETQTKFSLELPDFELTIAGDKRFVEDLYRQISQDLLPVLLSTGGQEERPPRNPTLKSPFDQLEPTSYTWVYGCTQYYQKVYVVNDDELRGGLLGPYIEPTRLRRIYVDRDHNDLFTAIGGRQKTLWAEFTEEGKELFQSGKERA